MKNAYYSLSLMLLLAPLALADNYNFASMSVNLKGAYKPEFFTQHLMLQPLSPAADAAASNGLQLDDGAYLAGGGAAEYEGAFMAGHGGVAEGFATKLDANGKMVWSWKSNHVGPDSCLGSAQLPNGEILVVGYRFVGDHIKRSLTKLNKKTGKEIWTMTDFGDTTKSNGAWEMVNVDATHGVILTGLMDKPDMQEYSFKSGGNTAGGKAVVSTMSIASLSSSTVPTISDVATTKTWSRVLANTAHTAHFVSATKIAALIWRDGGNLHSATVAVFNPTTGADLFTPVQHSGAIGEGTDMKLVGTNHAVISGHKTDTETQVGYSGRLSKVSLADGKLMWSKEYSSCGFGPNAVAGPPKAGQCSKGIIYNECWGVAVMADGGFALSCGTGIEGCSEGDLYADCEKGLGDKRPGAYPQFSGVWASLTVKTKADGTLDWQRADTYKCPNCPAMPKAPNLPMVVVVDEEDEGPGAPESAITSSAGEWIIPINGGTGVVVMTDQQTGLGLQKFVAPAANVPCSAVDSVKVKSALAGTAYVGEAGQAALLDSLQGGQTGPCGSCLVRHADPSAWTQIPKMCLGEKGATEPMPVPASADLYATTKVTMTASSGTRRSAHATTFDKLFVRVGDNGEEVGGPMAAVITEALYSCGWAPGYEWIGDDFDGYIADYTYTPSWKSLTLEIALSFPLSAIARSSWPELLGAVDLSVKCCQSSGALQRLIQQGAKEAKIDVPFKVLDISINPEVVVEQRAGSEGAGSSPITVRADRVDYAKCWECHDKCTTDLCYQECDRLFGLGKKSSGKTMFATKAEAEAAAKKMGCEGAHQMGSEWMVGATHTSCSGSVFDQVDPASVSTGVSTAAVSLHLNLSKLLLPLAVAAGLMRLL